jgi:hypothetical protein
MVPIPGDCWNVVAGTHATGAVLVARLVTGVGDDKDDDISD